MLQLIKHTKTIFGLSYASNQLATLAADRRGTAAIEFAIFGSLLSFAVLNVVDISTYIYKRMQVENATQMAAQAAWANCDLNHLPATKYCPALNTAVQNALQSTSLGTKVSLVPGSPSEGYYCINSSNALQYVSDVTTKPNDCTAASMPSLQPGDYIKITATFAYTPLFPGITVAKQFPTAITKTTLMRLM